MPQVFLARSSWAKSPFLGLNVDVFDESGVPGQWTGSGYGPAAGLTSDQVAAVAKQLTPNGLYLGAAFGKRTRRGTYGRKVADWSTALQNSAGTTSFVTGDLPPWKDGATRVLRLDQNAVASFGQQNPVTGSQAYMPKGTNPGFSMGLWVKNLAARTLNFELKVFNVAANRNITWNCAAEPASAFPASNGWVFITLSPSQLINASWVFGTDAVSFVRVTQKDNGAEGAWAAGEAMLFGNVYCDVAARPKFLLTFDDGNASQSRNNPMTTMRVSGPAFVSSTSANTLNTPAAHDLVVGEPLVFSETAPTSLVAGTTYWVQTVPNNQSFTLATDATLATTASTTGFAGTARYQYAGTQERSLQGIVESYGFRGSLFPVFAWLGTTGKYSYGVGGAQFMSASDLLEMWAAGWAVGSHSNTHPSNLENAGLRLLGPYGYYLSNTFDNLPAQYLTNFGITAGNGRRRIVSGTQASPSVFTTENASQFLPNQPIVFTNPAQVPTGCAPGVTYYVVPLTGTTFNLATDQGTLAARVNNTTGAWTGLADYRHPGSAPDDSAIYADIVACADGLKSLGITTAYDFFALPQGAADTYVRSAVMRAGFKWVRGITGGHSIPIGSPSGGGLNGVGNMTMGGWMQQPDAIQTDGTATLAANDTYVNECITQGACGCSYHHAIGVANLVAVDRLCQTLRTKVDAGLIDVLTLDEFAKEWA